MLGAAALLPFVLCAVAGNGFASWRCQSDGVARPSCCCPEGHESPTTGDRNAAIGEQDCCVVKHVQIEKAPSEVSRAQPAVAPPAPLLLPDSELSLAGGAYSARSSLRAPDAGPPGGRLLVLRKQAFLI